MSDKEIKLLLDNHKSDLENLNYNLIKIVNKVQDKINYITNHIEDIKEYIEKNSK